MLPVKKKKKEGSGTHYKKNKEGSGIHYKKIP
jgi:hypothetical protein